MTEGMTEAEFEDWLDRAFKQLIEDCGNRRPARTPDGREGQFVVILERIQEGVKPPYAVYGMTQCHWCDELTWVGMSTVKALDNGAKPMCQHCGADVLPRTGAVVSPNRIIDE